jgi:branched-chain amino acid transport system substrate-binding protein
VSLAGNFREVQFADLLEFYCLSKQTAAVSVTAGDRGSEKPIGKFFVEGGRVVDARFDGCEGVDAVRTAMRRLNDGAFQVELGARSQRRTVHEPWRTLLVPEVRAPERRDSSPAPRKTWPTASVPPAPLGRPDGAAIRPAPAAAPGHVVPPRRDLPAVPTAAQGPLTEPLPRLSREFLPGPFGRWFLAFGGALVVGGALAVAVGQLVEEKAGEELRPVHPTVSPSTPLRPMPAGVTDTEVTFGMAAPLSGPSKELGRQMKLGLETAFAAVNADGGIHGRSVRLVTVDDGYEPTRTREAVRQLAEEKGVFGFVGNVGTPAAALPYALGRHMLLFGPSSGASSLRKDPPDRTVFNYRASAAEETAAIVHYLVEVRRLRPEQIAVFAQGDSSGDTGFLGVVEALARYPEVRAVLKVTYRRNTTDVSNAVAQVLERRERVRAVVMVASYRAAARFIERVWVQRPQMVFASTSLVGSQALAEELLPLGPRFPGGVIVTQVVPIPTSHASALLRYREALARYAPAEKPDFGSLEGYVVGNLLLEGLRRSGRTVTTENMVRAVETIQSLDVGLGTQVSFGPLEHQGSHRVWGTVLEASGNYRPLELE